MANKPKATTESPVAISIGVDSAPASREAELEAENARLRAELAGKTTSNRAQPTYPEPKTPREVADVVLAQPNQNVYVPLPGAEFLANLRDRMVLRIPGTATADKPLGEGVLEVNQGGNKQYKVKKDLDRGSYITLGKLSKQLSGAVQEHRKPQPLSDEQINRVLRPILDELAEAGIFKFASK